MVNVDRAIRVAVDTGDVLMGERETLKAVKNGECKLVIVASNCPSNLREDLERFAKISGVQIYEYKGSSLDLGAVCGRPHVISMLGVKEAGDSDIFELGRR
jgi:large subunit ribosomal protein L30e